MLPWGIQALDVIGELRSMVAGLQATVRALSGEGQPPKADKPGK